MSTVEVILGVFSAVTAIGGYSVRSYRADKEKKASEEEKKELQKQLQEKDARMEANELYEKIRNKREIFEDSLADLTCLDDECPINVRKRAFLKVKQKYNALYNEVEDFCTKLIDGAINSESYIKESVVPILSSLAEKQVETFKLLNVYADKYSFEKIKQPDYKAFDKYDQFLVKYNGGEGSHFWRDLKNKRRDSGFE